MHHQKRQLCNYIHQMLFLPVVLTGHACFLPLARAVSHQKGLMKHMFDWQLQQNEQQPPDAADIQGSRRLCSTWNICTRTVPFGTKQCIPSAVHEKDQGQEEHCWWFSEGAASNSTAVSSPRSAAGAGAAAAPNFRCSCSNKLPTAAAARAAAASTSLATVATAGAASKSSQQEQQQHGQQSD